MVKELFDDERMYNSINRTLITLIPKTALAKIVKGYMPIFCCTTIYKIISKIMTNRLGKVLNNIIHHSQVTFFPTHSRPNCLGL